MTAPDIIGLMLDGLGPEATQDERFAAMTLTGPPVSLLDALSRLPGCPPDMRFAALIERGMPLIDMHCETVGDDRDELLRALWDRLHEEAAGASDEADQDGRGPDP